MPHSPTPVDVSARTCTQFKSVACAGGVVLVLLTMVAAGRNGLLGHPVALRPAANADRSRASVVGEAQRDPATVTAVRRAVNVAFNAFVDRRRLGPPTPTLQRACRPRAAPPVASPTAHAASSTWHLHTPFALNGTHADPRFVGAGPLAVLMGDAPSPAAGDGGMAGDWRCRVGSYDSHFDYFQARLLDVHGPGFALIRYADGELAVARNLPVQNGEYRYEPVAGEARLHHDMLASLRGRWGTHVFYAFASPADDPGGLVWFLQRTEQECGFISFANLWVNSHFQRTATLLSTLTTMTYPGRIVLVANQESVARVRHEHTWMADALPLPDNIPPLWEEAVWRARLLHNATQLALRYSGYLFLVAGGPPAKPLIATMWDANCDNRYVDMGSALDPLLRGKMTRGYHDPAHRTASQVDPDWTINTDGVAVQADGSRPVIRP